MELTELAFEYRQAAQEIEKRLAALRKEAKRHNSPDCPLEKRMRVLRSELVFLHEIATKLDLYFVK